MPVAFPDPRVESVHKVLITAEQTYYELRKLNHIPPFSLDFCIFIPPHFFVAGLFFLLSVSPDSILQAHPFLLSATQHGQLSLLYYYRGCVFVLLFDFNALFVVLISFIHCREGSFFLDLSALYLSYSFYPSGSHRSTSNKIKITGWSKA